MAFDWSFPSLPNDASDPQDFHFEDTPSLIDFQPFDQSSTSIEQNDIYPPDLLPFDQAWTGLSCTCGTIFTCNEHDDYNKYDPNDTEEHSSSAMTVYVQSMHANGDHAHSGPALSLARTNPVIGFEHDPIIQKFAKMTPEAAVAQRKQRTRISSYQNRILRHKIAINPYPTAKDIQPLSSHTGLSSKTITTWFSNYRSRKLKKQCKPCTQLPLPLFYPLAQLVLYLISSCSI